MRRRRLLSQPSCAGLFTGNCRGVQRVLFHSRNGSVGGSALGEFPSFPGAQSSPCLCFPSSVWGWGPSGTGAGSSPRLWAGMDPWLWCKAGAGLLHVPLLLSLFHLLQLGGQGRAVGTAQTPWKQGDAEGIRHRAAPSPCPKLIPCPGRACPWGWGSLCPPEQHPDLHPFAQGACEPLVPANHQPWVTFWEEEDFYLNKEIF